MAPLSFRTFPLWVWSDGLASSASGVLNTELLIQIAYHVLEQIKIRPVASILIYIVVFYSVFETVL